MHPITDTFRLYTWIGVGMAGLILTLLSIYLEDNIRLAIKKLLRQDLGGRRPSEKPLYVWVVYFIVASLSIVGAAVASTAPNAQDSQTLQTVSQASLLGINEIVPHRKPGTIRILFARFDGEDQSSRKISSEIKNALEKRLENESHLKIEVVGTGRAITELEGSEIAVKVGEFYQADIIIWGWYDVTDLKVPYIIHYEIIPTSDTFVSSLCAASSSPPERMGKREALENLTLQTNLANEFSYFTLFTLGLTYYERQDWEMATLLFQDAINYLPDDSILSASTVDHQLLVDEYVIYYFIGLALEESGVYDAALDNFQKLGNVWDGDVYYHLGVGKAYLGLGKYQDAINHFTLAYENSDSSGVSAEALLFRATAYYRNRNFAWADNDFNLALELDEMQTLNTIQPHNGLDLISPNENELTSPNLNVAVSHFFKAFRNEETNTNQAIIDYSKAIEMNPNFMLARQYRSWLSIDQEDYVSAKDDLLIVTQDENYRTPCNYLMLGYAYSGMDDRKHARKQFNEVILLTTNEIRENGINGYAFFMRGRANLELVRYYQAFRDFLIVKKLDSEETKDIDLSSYLFQSFIRMTGVTLIALEAIMLFIYVWKNYHKLRMKFPVQFRSR
jgi:tetratricopeptide (TPR) repeat protein